MDDLIIKEGRFFRISTKQFEKAEFGNDEQIACVRRTENLIESYNNEGHIIEPDYEVEITASAGFECICGRHLYKEVEASEEDDIDCFDGKEVNCSQCKRNYIFDYNDDGDLIVKLK